MSGTCDRRELPLIRTNTGFLFAFDTSEMSAMSHVQSEVHPNPLWSKSLSNSKIADAAACDWWRVAVQRPRKMGCTVRVMVRSVPFVTSARWQEGKYHSDTYY